MAGVTQVPVQCQPAEVVPVGLDRLCILVGGQHHPVAGRLQAQAQPAAAAEQIRRQMRTLCPEPGRIGEERLLVRARLWMGGQAHKRAPDELDTVVSATAWSLPRPPT